MHAGHFEQVIFWLSLAGAGLNFGVGLGYYVIMALAVPKWELHDRTRKRMKAFFFGCASHHMLLWFMAFIAASALTTHGTEVWWVVLLMVLFNGIQLYGEWGVILGVLSGHHPLHISEEE